MAFASIVLHDLLGGALQPWSPNTIRTRMLLHAKKLAFTTQWHSYPDVEDLLSSFGVEPALNEPHYTLPAVTLKPATGDAYTIMDSERIAQHIEERCPNPTMHLADPLVERASAAVTAFVQPLRILCVPYVPDRILVPAGDDRGAQWFRDTREKRMGRSLEAWVERMGGEAAWTRIAEEAAKVDELLKAKGGPFFLGKDVSWADIKLAAVLAWVKRLDAPALDRLFGLQPSIHRLWLAAEPLRPEVPS